LKDRILDIDLLPNFVEVEKVRKMGKARMYAQNTTTVK
jgi:hypothetical protein